MGEVRTPCVIARRIPNNNGYCNHRDAYEKAYGPVSKEYDIHHLCTNRNCINPEHLEPRLRSVNRSTVHLRRWRRVPEELECAVRGLALKGLSQREIAEATGVTGSSVCKILLGRPYG